MYIRIAEILELIQVVLLFLHQLEDNEVIFTRRAFLAYAHGSFLIDLYMTISNHGPPLKPLLTLIVFQLSQRSKVDRLVASVLAVGGALYEKTIYCSTI